ncbi:cysteine proteinase [Exidia glandulosa HHB12029]|uniref:Cysteine proteinase n=1 Tax=Exidia glandulosa HHB12029 TaxID=1314781 RepID=A0A165Q7B0_EXIGL|nr:cysteine proteinase [Exidia glandulosa HHB12029]
MPPLELPSPANSVLPTYDDAPPDYGAVPVSVHDTNEFVRYHFPPLQGQEEIELKVFRWYLRNSSWARLEASATPLQGPDFECGGAKWKILAYPGGVRGAPGNVSLFLVWNGLQARPQDKKTYTCAQFAFCMCNPSDPTVFETQNAQHRFTHAQPQWGFARYVANDALRATTEQRSKPILENDTLDIIVFVRVLRDPTGVLMHDFRDYDSKAVTGYVPLVNQGATDYLNAMLCTLFMNSYYRKLVYNIPTQGANPTESTAYALQRLFYRMQTNSSAVSTTELTKTFGWRAIDAFTPRDVFDFNSNLQERLEQEMKNTPDEGFIERLLYVRCETTRECIASPAEHRTVETTRVAQLKLPVAGMDTIYGALRELAYPHTSPCPLCPTSLPSRDNSATSRTRITHLPPILTLALDRFLPTENAIGSTRGRQRRPELLNYPPTLDMAEFIDDPAGQLSGPVVYNLAGIIVHESVVSDRGYHYAMLRGPGSGASVTGQQGGRWFKFDDERVVPALERDALEAFYGDRSAAAYGLVYIRAVEEPKVLCPVVDLDVPPHIRENIEAPIIPAVVPPAGGSRPSITSLPDRPAYEVSVRVVTDDMFKRHQGFDLVALDSSDIPRVTARWDERLGDVRQRFAQSVWRAKTQHGIRLRVVIQRQNKTCRPAWALAKLDDSMTMQQIKEKWGSARERSLVFYIEQITAATATLDPGKSLIFLKQFDYRSQTLRGFASVYITRSEPVRSLNRIICELLSTSTRTSVFAYYEEIQPVMVEPMSLNTTFQEAEIDTGDVICFEQLDDDDGLMPPPSRRTHFRNALSFYRYLMSTASADMATTRSTSRLS